MTRKLATGTVRVALGTILVLTPWLAASANEGPDATQTSVDLRILPAFTLQGRSVQTRVIVEPAASNRLLVVRIDSQSYYSSTERQLDGEAGPRTHFLNWHELPAGEYQVEAVVKDSRGQRTQAQGTFRVLGPDQAPPR
jgi:hypothetical protein